MKRNIEIKAVAKDRAIYLHQNVRIHLDRVESLGTFLELEAIVEGDDDAGAPARLERLRAALGITPALELSVSYSDLLAQAAPELFQSKLKGPSGR